MNIKGIFFSTVLLSIFPQMSGAQRMFKEMTYSKEKTVFRLNAPDKVLLRLYSSGNAGSAFKTLKMKNTRDGVWEATVKGNLDGKFYTFDTGHGECPGLFPRQ